MIYELKKINLWSVIKVSFLIHLAIGLAFGMLMCTIFSIIISLTGQLDSFQSFGNTGFNPAAFGIFGGVMIGLFYAFIIVVVNGIIAPFILVILYNLVAGWMGGLKFNLADIGQVSNLSQVTNNPSTSNGESTGGNISDV